MTSGSRHSPFIRFLLMPFMMLALMMALNACGDKEPEQRKAFISFLQTRVVDKPELAIPQLTAEEKSAFGKYADDYAIITDFHKQLNETLVPALTPVFAGMSDINSIDKLLQKRDELNNLAKSSNDWQQKMAQLRKDADAKHAALKQPDDLKAVYDKAYDKTVVKPDVAAEKVFGLMPKILTLVVEKADIIKAQGNKAQVVGNSVQFSDQKTLDKYNQVQEQLQPLAGELIQASTELQQMMH